MQIRARSTKFLYVNSPKCAATLQRRDSRNLHKYQAIPEKSNCALQTLQDRYRCFAEGTTPRNGLTIQGDIERYGVVYQTLRQSPEIQVSRNKLASLR